MYNFDNNNTTKYNNDNYNKHRHHVYRKKYLTLN